MKFWLGMINSQNMVCKRRLTAKETSIPSCEVLDEKYRIAFQGMFVGIIIKASAASLKVTDLLFTFAFCKKKPGKLVSCSLAVCCLLILINEFSELFRPAVKHQNNLGQLQSVFVKYCFSFCL